MNRTIREGRGCRVYDTDETSFYHLFTLRNKSLVLETSGFRKRFVRDIPRIDGVDKNTPPPCDINSKLYSVEYFLVSTEVENTTFPRDHLTRHHKFEIHHV